MCGGVRGGGGGWVGGEGTCGEGSVFVCVCVCGGGGGGYLGGWGVSNLPAWSVIGTNFLFRQISEQ